MSRCRRRTSGNNIRAITSAGNDPMSFCGIAGENDGRARLKAHDPLRICGSVNSKSSLEGMDFILSRISQDVEHTSPEIKVCIPPGCSTISRTLRTLAMSRIPMSPFNWKIPLVEMFCAYLANVLEGRISEIVFKAKGCVPTIACASAITELVKRRPSPRSVRYRAKILSQKLEDYRKLHPMRRNSGLRCSGSSAAQYFKSNAVSQHHYYSVPSGK